MKVDFKVQLAPFDSTMAETVRPWRNDYRVMRWCRQKDFVSDVDQGRWFDRQAADPTIQMYAIQTALEGKTELVGVCGFTSIDWQARLAEFSIYVRPDYHGKGLGREALKLLLQHGFVNLGLRQIWGETLNGNPAANLFEELGFRRDGMRRHFYFKDGAYHDAHLYSILRDEWISSLSASSSSGSRASSPTPSGPASGSQAEGGQVLDIKPTPRRRGPNKPKARDGSPSPSPTSEPGSSSRMSASEPAP